MTRLPRRVRILDVIVRVQQVGSAELMKLGEEARPLDGLWDDATRTIYIRKSASMRTKRQVFLHELQHALIDLKEWETHD